MEVILQFTHRQAQDSESENRCTLHFVVDGVEAEEAFEMPTSRNLYPVSIIQLLHMIHTSPHTYDPPHAFFTHRTIPPYIHILTYIYIRQAVSLHSELDRVSLLLDDDEDKDGSMEDQQRLSNQQWFGYSKHGEQDTRSKWLLAGMGEGAGQIQYADHGS